MNKKFLLALAVAAFIGTGSAMAETIKTIQYRVENMRCGGCAGRVKKALTVKEGVGNVTIDMEKKVVTISYDADKVTPETLASTITDAKFTPEAYSKSDVITRKVSYKAAQMRCGGCAGRVKNNMGKVEGVQSVEVDLATKSVAITYDANKVSKNSFKDEFKKFGYTVTMYVPNKMVAYAQLSVTGGDLSAAGIANLAKTRGFLDINANEKTGVLAVAYITKAFADEAAVKAELQKAGYTVAE